MQPEFWIPGPHGVRQHGRLVFDPIEGTTLTLADPLVERMANGEEQENNGGVRARILGIIDYGNARQPVTLIDCVWANRRKYRPNSFLVGGHFESDDDSAFESVIVRLRDAAPWVNREALTVDVDSAIDAVDRRRMVCRLDLPEEPEARFLRGVVTVGFHWSREDFELESFTVRYWPAFVIEYNKMTRLSEVIEDVGHLHSLSSLCVDRADAFISVRAYRSDHPETSIPGEPFAGTRRPIELKARMQESGRRSAATPLSPHAVIVSLDELGGVQSIASWLDRMPSITPIIGSLLTMRA